MLLKIIKSKRGLKLMFNVLHNKKNVKMNEGAKLQNGIQTEKN